MKKRLVSAAVTVALFIGLIAGVNFKASDKKEIKHFTAFFSVEGDNIDPDNDIKQLIAEQIGAECEETWLVGQDKDDAINSLIATGEYPDFVLGETALYEADALIPIDEYWDDYPNIKEYLSDEQWEKLRQPDGHIYWIPPFGISHGDDVEMLHNGEAFWIQTRVLKWAGYPKITTIEQYFDLIESYVQANPTMPDGTENIPFTMLCDDWRYFCLENVPQFLDGFPNDGSCMVDTETKKVMDYNVTDTAKRYFGKLNEEFRKGIMDPGAFNATYDQYLDKLSTGAVLGMVDQWWQFYYAIDPVFKKQNLAQLGCDYVPLPVTIDDGIHNRWHTNRMAEIDYSSGVSITTSCKDIEGAMKFISDLLEPDIIRERFWGEEGKDYSVDENGLFYLTNEQAEKKSDSSYRTAHMCSYSYFPRVEGMLDDGINAFSMEYQPEEFYKNQPADIQECFDAYGVENYVELLGKNDAPGSWYPMYSYSDSIPTTSECGKVKNNLEAVKKRWLPQVIMADDFDAAWNQYMDEYNACNPQIYFDYLQQKVNEN